MHSTKKLSIACSLMFVIAVGLAGTTDLVRAQKTAGKSEQSKGTKNPTKSKPTKRSAKPSRSKQTVKPVSKSKERQALKFAREHHRELAKLLSVLKQKDMKQYSQAINELAQKSERISKMSDAKRRMLTLEVWKLESRIRLKLARQSMSDDVVLGSEILKLIVDRNKARLELYKSDLKRLHVREIRLEKSIKRLESDPIKTAQHELDNLRKRAKKYNVKVRTRTKRPTTKRPTKPKSTIPTSNKPNKNTVIKNNQRSSSPRAKQTSKK